jgi:NADPH2:quinone reductase
MRAAVGVPGVDAGILEIREVPVPKPGDGQVLLRVHASALNRSETVRRRGHLLKPGAVQAPEPIGGECAGEVEEVGAGVTAVRAGDRVMCRSTGCHAEYVLINQRAAMPVPDRLSWEEAASMPNVFVTAHDALTTSAGIQAGESVLINAASSGVGVAAIQVARVLGAKPVLATSSSQAKLNRLKPLGLDVGILTSAGLAEAVRSATGGKGVDVIIDNVGGTVFQDNLRAMAYKGRLVQVGRLASSTSEIDLDFLARWRLRLIGTSFRQRNAEEVLAASEKFAAEMLPAIADGRLQPVVDRAFPLDQLQAAYDYMESNAQVGKIVITM